MFKKILVPVDLSHPEKAGIMIDAATKMGGKGAKITMISVVENIPAYVASELPRGILAQREENAKQELDDIAKASGQKMQTEVRIGNASTSILDAAEDIATDLIIVASHRPGLQDYLLGSTAARIVRHAKCSVLVLR